MMRPTIQQMRSAVADDLYDTVTNCRKSRGALVGQAVAAMSDEDVVRAFHDAELGETIDADA